MKALPKFFSVFVLLLFGVIAAAQDQCSPESKKAIYDSFLTNRTTDQPKAYEEAKKYLACPNDKPTEAEQKIVDYLNKYVNAFETGQQKRRFIALIYDERKLPEAYALAKEILAKQPDDLTTLVHAGASGYLLVGQNDPALTARVMEYSRRALQQLDAGKNLDDWRPFAGRDVAVAYLNFTIGAATIEHDPTTALDYLIKSAQFDTPLKKSPYTYAYIAGAYEIGDYTKQSDVYKRDFADKEESAQSKLALANIYQIVDRMIDAYARAIALAGADPGFAKPKAEWNASLTTWYKFRNKNTDTGLSEFINTVLSKPLPPRPTPLTSIK